MLKNNKLIKYIKKDFLATLIYFIRYHFLLALKTLISTKIFIIKSKISNVTLDRGSQITGMFNINKYPLSQIIIGKNFKSMNDLKISGMSYSGRSLIKTFTSTAKVVIGNGVELNSSSILVNSSEVYIGNDVIIAPNCLIMDSNFHSVARNLRSIRNPNDDLNIHIGNNVWIGVNSIILKGVRIGENSIIAAGSIVRENIPPNSIYKTSFPSCKISDLI